uniref:Cys-tRNA(Pro) deacylase n=1 Tax=Eubacterium cellulosolvens TaxID=29322 RepID=UPI000482BA88|nr:Cys-tRNA(Pro) deacylase [[Eubacterium] cellulosolvens]
MAKEAKTNAMRILDKGKVSYEVLSYECEAFIDGMHMAEATGAPVDQSYKTIVTKGKSGQHYVLVIPIAEEIDLKKAAKAVGEKAVEMVHVKELFGLTGYVRGGCSPIGMKKQFPTILDSSAERFDKIYISGGRVGLSLCVAPSDILKVSGGTFGQIVR